MHNTYTLNGKIIVELGGMQISRDQLDAVKAVRKKDTDQDAVDYLIQVAEAAFTKDIEQAEFLAVDLNDDNWGQEYVSPDEHLSAAYCDAIRK
jgi:hypothetical protein